MIKMMKNELEPQGNNDVPIFADVPNDNDAQTRAMIEDSMKRSHTTLASEQLTSVKGQVIDAADTAKNSDFLEAPTFVCRGIE